jgi:homoserine kinase type II
VISPISEEVLRSVLDRFGLSEARFVRSFEASTRNDNLLVASGNGEQFVLRRYRRNRDLPRIEFQLRFQQWLFEQGFPTPRVVLAGDGQSLVVTDAGPFGVCTYIEGDYYDYDRPAHRAEAGRRLAEFHMLTASFPEPMGEYELKQPIREWWSDPERELAELVSVFGADLHEELPLIREWIRGLHGGLSLEEFDALPAGWIHNDYHGRNVLFQEDRIAALLDYDKVQIAPYAVEIASAVFTFGRVFRGSEDVRVDFAREFLAGYESRRQLGEREREVFLTFMGMAQPPFGRIYGMVARDGQDALAALRANVASQRARRVNAHQLAGRL